MDQITMQNLRDAGCDESFIAEYQALTDQNQRIGMLRTYRKKLSGDLRLCHRELNCLDYLLYQVMKNENQDMQKPK